MKKYFRLFLILTLLAFLFGNVTQNAIAQTTWTVDDDGPADFSKIRDAINTASFGDTIRVAEGIYSPTTNYESFPIIMKNGVSLIGAEANGCILDANNTTRVIYLNNIRNTSTKIEGFTIRGGNGYYGGGIECRNYSSPIIINNIIENNVARWGGGICCHNRCSPIIRRNIIRYNSPAEPRAGGGGGIICMYSSPSTISHNHIYENTAKLGGGIYCWNSDAIIANNIINENSSNSWGEGGGIYIDKGVPLVVNNTLIRNNSILGNGRGGGIFVFCKPPDFPKIINNIVVENKARYGAGIYSYSYRITIEHNNIWNNTGGDYFNCIPGTGHISVDPRFVDLSGGDFHLQPDSLCIEAGNKHAPGLPALDFDGNPRINDGNGDGVAEVDMGVYEIYEQNQPPVAACQDIVVVAGEDCTAHITASDLDEGSYDPDDDPITFTYNPDGPYPIGDTQVILTVEDDKGASSTCTATVTVKDDTPPVPDIPELPTLQDECLVEITSFPTASDNCAGTIQGITTDPPGYTVQGNYIVTWTYDDGNGNTSSQTQAIIIKDIIPPVPDMASLPIVRGQCSVEITEFPTANDNCIGEVIGTADSLTYSEQGTYSVKWSYDDGNGNISYQTQAVIVKDDTAPEISLTDPICVNVGKGKGKMANKLTVGTSDNCLGSVVLGIENVEIFNNGGQLVNGKGVYDIDGNDVFVYPNANGWSILVTVTAVDDVGNSNSQTLEKALIKCKK